MNNGSFMDVMKRSRIRNTETTAEIITSYEWDFRFTKVPGLWGGDNPSESTRKYMELFRCRTDSVTTPEEPVNQPVSVMIRGHQFSQPGMSNNFGTFGFILQDFADTGIQKDLMALQYAMSLPNTKGMKDAANRFFFDGELYQLNPERKLIKKWVVKDCLLIQAQVQDAMNSSKAAVGQTNVSFSTDFYTIEYPLSPTDSMTDPTYYYNSLSAAGDNSNLDGGDE